MADDKPRVRVSAGSDKQTTFDAFQNFSAGTGIGTNNLTSGSTYGYSVISRNRMLLENMYRGSWIARKVVDVVADDMTRAGVAFSSDMAPEESGKMFQHVNELQLWPNINRTIKWSRLYGGAVALMLIDGQNPATPLNLNTIRKGQFKGLLPLDRWTVYPNLLDTVDDFGPDYGMPVHYDIVADARRLPQSKLHYSRLIRMDGVELPYWQRQSENWWGMSIIEPMFDRIVAFDSATQGTAQLVYRAHLRTISVAGLRTLLAGGAGSLAMQGLQNYFGLVRVMQSNEGLTVLDADDKFEAFQYSFGGLSDVLLQLGQQIAGAADIPLVRFFGQSPAGLSATGESDIRNYYDFIRAQQQARLHQPLLTLFDLTHRSLFGKPLPEGFDIQFNPLWQLSPEQKTNIAKVNLEAVDGALQSGLIDTVTGMRELRESAKITGVFTKLTDEMIDETEKNPPEQLIAEQQAIAMEQQKAGLEGQKMANEGGSVPEDGADKKDEDSSSRDHAFVKDIVKLPTKDIHGIRAYIETRKGGQRVGYGWADAMPCDYGYIARTSSGPQEQMDCFIGPAPDSVMAWVVDQVDPDKGSFDGNKVFLGLTSKHDVVDTYNAAFRDGSGPRRLGTVRAMPIDILRKWLEASKHGDPIAPTTGQKAMAT